MIGILSVGGYVPRYRLSGKALCAVWGAGGAGERAVAGYDEDSLTMAAEAALIALHGRDAKTVGACFLASTSAPYAEKSSAAIVATVADMPAAVLTADLGGSLRAGTTALRLALDMVKAGSAAHALVAAADVRPVAPGAQAGVHRQGRALRPRRADPCGPRQAAPAQGVRDAEGAGDRPGRQYRHCLLSPGSGGGARRVEAGRPGSRRLLWQRRRGAPLPVHRSPGPGELPPARLRPAGLRRAAPALRQVPELPPPRRDRGGARVLQRAHAGARGEAESPALRPAVPGLRRRVLPAAPSLLAVLLDEARRVPDLTAGQGLHLHERPLGAESRSAHRHGVGRSRGRRALLRPAHRLRSRHGHLRDAGRALPPAHPRGRRLRQLLLEVQARVKERISLSVVHRTLELP